MLHDSALCKFAIDIDIKINITDHRDMILGLGLQLTYRVVQKVSFQKSSLNRIKNCQFGYISHQFWA